MSAFSWRGRPRLAWLLAVAFLLALDQLSKTWFASTIALGTAVEVTTWFNLVHVLNTGAAFSLLAEAGGWQRIFFIVIGFMVVVPITFVCLARQVEPLERAAGALLVAGGSGIKGAISSQTSETNTSVKATLAAAVDSTTPPSVVSTTSVQISHSTKDSASAQTRAKMETDRRISSVCHPCILETLPPIKKATPA